MPPEFDITRDSVRPEPTYFRGIDELLDNDQFRQMMKDEFPEDAPEWLDPVSRRQFVTLMGASLALAGVAGCNPSFRPAAARKNLPYVGKPDAVTPGVPLFYSSTISLAASGPACVVKSLEGRPLKIEGNPAHPSSLGATDIYTQGSLLGLYDPHRSQTVLHQGVSSQWDKARLALIAAFDSHKKKEAKGQFVVVTDNTSSPTLTALIEEAVTAVGGKWVRYEPASPVNAWEGARLAFGKVVNPVYTLDAAKVVLALDWDVNTAPLCYARQLTKHRKVRISDEAKAKGQGLSADEMSRIYAVETMVTGTGAVADHRLPLKPSEIESFLRALAEKLGVTGGPKPGPLSELAKNWIDPRRQGLAGEEGRGHRPAGDHLPAERPCPRSRGQRETRSGRQDGQFHRLGRRQAGRPSQGDLKDLVADLAAGKRRNDYRLRLEPGVHRSGRCAVRRSASRRPRISFTSARTSMKRPRP